MNETRSLINAIKNNISSVDARLTLYTDSFNENIADSINVQFNKKLFDINNSQMLFISKDLDSEKIKDQLIEKGISLEKIKLIENWSEMPLSCRNMNVDSLIEIFITSLLKEASIYFTDENNIQRLVFLFACLMRDVQSNEINFNNIPNYTRETLTSSFVHTKEFLNNHYVEGESISISNLDLYFKIINKITKLFYVNNDFDEKTYYLLKPKTVIEEMVLASYIRYFNCLFRDNNEDMLYEFENPKKKQYKTAFVDFKDFLIDGFGVRAANERDGFRMNVFLTQNSFENGVYSIEELTSLKANAELKYRKSNTELSRYIFDKKFQEHYYRVKKEYKTKKL